VGHAGASRKSPYVDTPRETLNQKIQLANFCAAPDSCSVMNTQRKSTLTSAEVYNVPDLQQVLFVWAWGSTVRTSY